MKMKATTLICLFTASAVLAGCVGSQEDEGRTLNVPADYDSIQAAIDAAEDGDTVVVAPGTYVERIDFNGTAITVRSTDPDDPEVVAATVIDGNVDAEWAEQGAVVRFASGETEDAVLEGFTITGGQGDSSSAIVGNAGSYGGGVFVAEGSTPVVRGNVITENDAQYGSGIAVVGGARPIIEGNTIAKNDGHLTHGGGIFVGRDRNDAGAAAVIQDNVIREHSSSRGGAIAVYSSEATIVDNTMENNEASRGGAILGDNATLSIEGNIVQAHRGHGTLSLQDSFVILENNQIRDNGPADYGHGAVYITGRESVAIVTNNDITDNHATSHGGGITVLGVDTQVEITNNTIVRNVANGPGGGGIRVEQASALIVDNEIIANEAACGGGIYVGSDGGATIENNRIADNVATDPAGNWGGGGICALQSATDDAVIIANNEITGNSAVDSGGGIDARARGTIIQNNSIRDNWVGSESHWDASGGGLYIGGDAGILVEGNLIQANRVSGESSAKGGGLSIYERATILNNTFLENVVTATARDQATSFGGAVYLDDDDGNTTIAGNLFEGNRAEGGDPDPDPGPGEISIYGGSFGGGIYVWHSDGARLHCNDFVNNHARNSGAGLYVLGQVTLVDYWVGGNTFERNDQAISEYATHVSSSSGPPTC